RRIIVRHDLGCKPVPQRCHTRWLRTGMNIVSRELANWLLLLDVGEAKLLASGERFVEMVEGNLLTPRPFKERRVGVSSLLHVVCQQAHVAPGASGDLKVVPRLVRHIEGDGLAGKRITIPIGQFKIVVAADQAGAVVNTRPRRLAN